MIRASSATYKPIDYCSQSGDVITIVVIVIVYITKQTITSGTRPSYHYRIVRPKTFLWCEIELCFDLSDISMVLAFPPVQ
jgi:hypothetical protein